MVSALPSAAQIPELDEDAVNRIWDGFNSDNYLAYDLPADFVNRPPSAAALEFVERGRSAQHRKNFHLTLPETPLPPPKTGWLVLEEIPHSCWVSRKEITALSLDPNKRQLIIGDYTSGNRNPADPSLTTAGYALRIIDLTPAQATRIIEFVWSLHQIKSIQVSQPPPTASGSSSADSRGYLYLSGGSSYLGEYTIWYTWPIRESWRGDYNKTSCLNFAAHFFRRGVPALLKDRWQPSSLRHTSRQSPSYRGQTREQLTQQITQLLRDHQRNPLPNQLLAFLVDAIGECGMESLEDSLGQLQKTLPPLTDLETFLSESSLHNTPIEDYDKFRKRNLTTLDLRENLDHALTQLDALKSDEKLLPFARSRYFHGEWARRKLQFSRSRIARDFHLRQFYDAPTPGFKSVAMTRLAQYSPKLTRSLIADLSDRRWKEFATDFARIVPTPNKRLEQTLRAIAHDNSLPTSKRGEAIEILGEITPVDRNELVSFLIDFSQHFKNSPESRDKNALKIAEIEALINLGAILQSWDLIKAAILEEGTWSNHLLPGLSLQCLVADPNLKNEIDSTLEAAIIRFPHLLKTTALSTLALDLPKLTAAIARKKNYSLETRLAASFHARESPYARFTVLASWAIQNHWSYDRHPTLFHLLESLTKESPPEQVRAFLNRIQSQTDHDGFALILRLKSLLP